MSRTKFVKKLNEEIMAERQREIRFNKPIIEDFIARLELIRDTDKRCKWFDLKEIIENFVSFAYKNDEQIISYDRYFYKYGINQEDIQSRIKKDLYWYKANYYVELNKDLPKKQNSIWLKLYAFQVLEDIRINHFNFSDKYHIDVVIDFLKEYGNERGKN